MNTIEDLKVIEILCGLEDDPRYYIVCDEFEDEAADGTTYDYKLSNPDSGCEEALRDAISHEFGFGPYELPCYDIMEDNYLAFDHDSELIDEEKEKEINAFAKKWLEEHEFEVKSKFYNYFDGSNWQSLLVWCENDNVNWNKDYEVLDDDKAAPILAAYLRAANSELEYNSGYATYHDEETGLMIQFSQYSYNVGYATIY